MKLQRMEDILSGHEYPGRGILLGRSKDAGKAIAAYFIMGRSENSRNRIFEKTDDGIRTRAFDETKMTDPSLIIYHPVRRTENCMIVTNGDQTDTIRDFLAKGECYVCALRSRCFEPDPPNYTPRISGVQMKDGSYKLSILKSANGDPSCNHRCFFEYDNPPAGTGHFIHTYQANQEPLPSFEGEPRLVACDVPDAETLAALLWNSLNEENKVALYVCYTDLRDGSLDEVIINKHA